MYSFNWHMDFSTSPTGWVILLVLYGLSAGAPAFSAWGCYLRATGAKMWKHNVLWFILALITSVLLFYLGKHAGLDSSMLFMEALPFSYLLWAALSSWRAVVKIRQKKLPINDLAGMQLLWLMLSVGIWFCLVYFFAPG